MSSEPPQPAQPAVDPEARVRELTEALASRTTVEATLRQAAQQIQELSTEVLAQLQNHKPVTEMARAVLAAIRRTLEFDAVGLRIRNGEDFPYRASEGFSRNFLDAENSLVVWSPTGDLCRDESGNALLECTCGLVLTGRTDPANPLFTAGGSAWTNEARELLKIPTRQDPRFHPRNRCIHEGFQSIALVPVRAGDAIIGLLQLNDRRKDRLTVEVVRALENLAAAIGLALMWRWEEQARFESDSCLRLLLKGMADTAVVLDRKRIVIAANEAFADELGRPLDACVGQLLDTLLPPGLAQLQRGWVVEVLRHRRPMAFEGEDAGRNVHRHIHPVPGPDGEITRLLVLGAAPKGSSKGPQAGGPGAKDPAA